jgi:hypothetical protein
MIAKPNRTATGPNGPSPLPDETTIARRKEDAQAWFADPARPHLRRLRGLARKAAAASWA